MFVRQNSFIPSLGADQKNVIKLYKCRTQAIILLVDFGNLCLGSWGYNIGDYTQIVQYIAAAGFAK